MLSCEEELKRLQSEYGELLSWTFLPQHNVYRCQLTAAKDKIIRFGATFSEAEFNAEVLKVLEDMAVIIKKTYI